MKRVWGQRRLTLAALFLSFCLALSAAGCGSKSTEIPQATKDQLQELSDAFVTDLLRDAIPFIEDEEALKATGWTISTQKKTYNIKAVRDFYADYEAGRNTAVTFVFDTTSFVATRVVFQGGVGYYLRYQHDPKIEGDTLPVTGKIIDSVTVQTDEALGKAELVLHHDKATVATFTFKNILIVPNEEESSEESA